MFIFKHKRKRIVLEPATGLQEFIFAVPSPKYRIILLGYKINYSPPDLLPKHKRKPIILERGPKTTDDADAVKGSIIS